MSFCAPHIYTGGFSGGPIARDAFQAALDEARAFGGVPVVAGEWGAAPERARPGGDPYFTDHQRLQDELRFGATLWTWRESCGEPHKVADLRAGRMPAVWGEFEVDCRMNTVTRLRGDVVAQLSQAYVRAAPGRLLRTVYDPPTQRLTASGSSVPRHRTLVASHSSALARPSVTTTGLRHVRLAAAPGGSAYITVVTTVGPWTLDVQGGVR